MLGNKMLLKNKILIKKWGNKRMGFGCRAFNPHGKQTYKRLECSLVKYLCVKNVINKLNKNEQEYKTSV